MFSVSQKMDMGKRQPYFIHLLVLYTPKKYETKLSIYV